MRVAIMQPYFMPYIGYFQLIHAVDTFVIYDDVNFIKKGWAARNYILSGGKKQLFSIRLGGSSQNKQFNEISIVDDFKKFRKTIEQSYSKSKNFDEGYGLLVRIIEHEDKCLSSFVAHSLQLVSNYLSIPTKILLSSNIDKDCSLKGQDKILQMCQILNATDYINPIGGQELYSSKDFAEAGITLHFIKPSLLAYRQNSKEFIPGLSLIDVIMNNFQDETRQLLANYQLID